jgi:hypothetical protein
MGPGGATSHELSLHRTAIFCDLGWKFISGVACCMSKSVFGYAFERDICLTALEDAGLAERVLRRNPVLEGERGAELIAGARQMLTAGRLKPKIALRHSGALVDAGLAGEAVQVLLDERAPFGDREGLRQAWLARALLATGETAAARSAFASLQGRGDDGSDLLAAMAWALGRGERPDAGRAAHLAQRLCVWGLADAAAEALAPYMSAAAPDDLIAAAFGVMRLSAPGKARALLEAMAPIYAAEDRAGSLAATLAVLDGRADSGDEAEPQDASARRLLLRSCLAEACAATRLWPAAIRRLEFAGKRGEEPGDALCELARCVGRDRLDHMDIRLLPHDGAPRIFDVFNFNGEFAMLQLKLREMAGWTDRFILAEADATFTGLPKRLYFQENPDAGQAFAGQIVHVTAPAPLDHIAYTWAREFFQKDSAVAGLSGRCAADDLVILSDVDEFTDRAAVEGFDGSVATLELRTFRFFINCEVVFDRPQLKSAVARARFVAAHGWNYLRLGAARYRAHGYLPKAGWHFTSIGNPQWLARKMQCTSHEEWSYMDQAFFEKRLRRFRQGALGAGFARREIDESFPASIRENREDLADFIL